jgi:predicted nucleic acid-binding protein
MTSRMPDLVFDTCVLSNFALVERLAILEGLYARRAWVTDFVVLENLRGIQKGYAGLAEIPKALSAGWLRLVPVNEEKERRLFEQLSTSLGAGEASSIAAARARGFVFACDDKLARREAALVGVKLTGTIGILVHAIRSNVLSMREANKILKRMKELGFHAPVTRITGTMVTE